MRFLDGGHWEEVYKNAETRNSLHERNGGTERPKPLKIRKGEMPAYFLNIHSDRWEDMVRALRSIKAENADRFRDHKRSAWKGPTEERRALFVLMQYVKRFLDALKTAADPYSAGCLVKANMPRDGGDLARCRSKWDGDPISCVLINCIERLDRAAIRQNDAQSR